MIISVNSYELTLGIFAILFGLGCRRIKRDNGKLYAVTALGTVSKLVLGIAAGSIVGGVVVRLVAVNARGDADHYRKYKHTCEE